MVLTLSLTLTPTLPLTRRGGHLRRHGVGPLPLHAEERHDGPRVRAAAGRPIPYVHVVLAEQYPTQTLTLTLVHLVLAIALPTPSAAADGPNYLVLTHHPVLLSCLHHPPITAHQALKKTKPLTLTLTLTLTQALKKTKTKTKMSLKESAAYLASSAYIRNLAVS